MNRYALPNPNGKMFGTLIVRVRDRGTEFPAATVYAGLNSGDREDAAYTCC